MERSQKIAYSLHKVSSKTEGPVKPGDRVSISHVNPVALLSAYDSVGGVCLTQFCILCVCLYCTSVCLPVSTSASDCLERLVSEVNCIMCRARRKTVLTRCPPACVSFCVSLSICLSVCICVKFLLYLSVSVCLCVPMSVYVLGCAGVSQQ